MRCNLSKQKVFQSKLKIVDEYKKKFCQEVHYLITFTPTEEKTVWSKMATKNIPCETVTMIKKRLH